MYLVFGSLGNFLLILSKQYAVNFTFLTLSWFTFSQKLLFTVSFGPAHPAAHGVFRLILEMFGEVSTEIAHSQGLLFRATENLIENRNLDLIGGYFARLDYVSFSAMEIALSSVGFSLGTTSALGTLLFATNISNHFLNLSCTVADAGAVGAILWVFEAREIFAEISETISGARFHSNFTQWAFSCKEFSSGSVSLIRQIGELLLFAGTTIRISRSRLFSNLQLSVSCGISSGVSGILLNSAGVFDLLGSNSQNVLRTQFLGGLSGCSLIRHFLRCRQIENWNCELEFQKSTDTSQLRLLRLSQTRTRVTTTILPTQRLRLSQTLTRDYAYPHEEYQRLRISQTKVTTTIANTNASYDNPYEEYQR